MDYATQQRSFLSQLVTSNGPVAQKDFNDKMVCKYF